MVHGTEALILPDDMLAFRAFPFLKDVLFEGKRQ